jgi:hypothetical protein
LLRCREKATVRGSAADIAAATEPPLSVTKRGALLFARKSR